MNAKVNSIFLLLLLSLTGFSQTSGCDPGSAPAGFARFVHSAQGFNFYGVRLKELSPMERGYFNDEARFMGIILEDKAEIGKDTAYFYSPVDDTTRTLSDLNKIYENTLNQRSWFQTIQNLAPAGSPTTCESANVACSNNIYSFESGTTGTAVPPVNNYPNYGCLGSEPGPAWYYMQVSQPGNIIIGISQKNSAGQGKDVDFICWGPFSSLSEGCATGLTGNCGIPGKPGCCTNTVPSCRNFYPSGNMVDCSYDPAYTETCTIPNGQIGEIYILLITNFSQQPATITFSQTGGTGITNCNIVYHCGIVALTAFPGSCDPLTNTFTISGNVEFTNPPPTGTLEITDITTNPRISQSLLPPFTSPLSYTLTGIPCDGNTHQITAVFSDSSACNLNQTIVSPPGCPSAVMSGGGIVCASGTATALINIDVFGNGPYTLTYALDGVPQAPVIFNGPSPYQFTTAIPGTYTLVSVSNSNCPGPGEISGSAVVTVDPGPLPVITGSAESCLGSSGLSYGTQSGNTGYTWNISPGGNISAGNGTASVTVNWNTPGNQWISVNYQDPQGCFAITPALFPVLIHPPPAVSFSACFDTVTTTNARPFRLTGGIPMGGTYSGPGITSLNYFSPWLSGAGTKVITYTYNDYFGCQSARTARIHVYAPGGFICGNNFTDIRDNKVYPTVQIGSQCWMAKNLNYGNRISSIVPQFNNCVNEKYCHGDNNGNCNVYGGLYQWDELMRYDDTPLTQGLCPPSWHVPAGTEWTQLFNNYINNAFAASYLKFSGFSGFEALLPGVYHQNDINWRFANFATFFWTANAHTSYKAWAQGMNVPDPSLSLYPSPRSNAFSVRCIKD